MPAFNKGVALALMLFLLTACANPDADPDAGVVEGGEPARRIVALAPNITEMLFAAGAGERLVATVAYSDYPAGALGVPRIGDSFRIDYEALGAAAPDLVIAWQSGNPPEVVERIRDLGYRVVMVESADLDSIADQIELIGELAGTSAVARVAAADYRTRLAALRARPQPRTLSLFWQISADPYFTVTGKHVIDEIIGLCGGRNIFRDLPGLAPAVTLEAILAERPEVIIASVKPGTDSWEEGWQRWNELPAVKNAALYSVDPDLVSRSGPRIIEGAVQVCAALEQARS